MQIQVFSSDWTNNVKKPAKIASRSLNVLMVKTKVVSIESRKSRSGFAAFSMGKRVRSQSIDCGMLSAAQGSLFLPLKLAGLRFPESRSPTT